MRIFQRCARGCWLRRLHGEVDKRCIGFFVVGHAVRLTHSGPSRAKGPDCLCEIEVYTTHQLDSSNPSRSMINVENNLASQRTHGLPFTQMYRYYIVGTEVDPAWQHIEIVHFP